ncbi:Uncharacterised protein [Vibrio cholerae]|nr:Uncharacterised protein [Vibrio cholerae]
MRSSLPRFLFSVIYCLVLVFYAAVLGSIAG